MARIYLPRQPKVAWQTRVPPTSACLGIVGGSYGYLNQQAWIWQPNTGVQSIGPIHQGSLTALDVSDNGKIVVGFVSTNRAFIWRKGYGARNLITFLKTHGAVVPDGWQLIAASLISADGNTIYGWGFNPDNLIEMYKVVLN